MIFLNVRKGAIYGALPAFPLGYLAENREIHWGILYSLVFGSLGAINGSVYGILIPIASEEIILDNNGWYISN